MLKAKRMAAAAAVLLLLTGMLAACGSRQGGTSGQSTAAEPSGQPSTPAAAEQSAFPLKVKDSTGYEMTIDKKPKAIVSLTLGTDEMLLSLVDGSRIKALSGKIAEDDGISNIADRAGAFLKAENNLELVISLKPDIVFAADWMRKEGIQQMRDAKIPVYCYKTANSIEEQKSTLMEIARVVGEEAKGREIVEDMDKRINAVEEKVKTLKPEERLTVLSYNSYGSTSSKGTTFDDIVTRAGLINAAAQAGLEPNAQISKEKIVEINPDVLFLPLWSYDKKQDPAAFADEIRKDKSLASVKAVKNNRIYLLPDKHMSAISQYIALGVEDAAKAAYPQLFK
ncbi:MAG: ABC transporter substrate-binding protein [Clostridiales bacterium]|jgi:iron complex transport system substrate-binding protein|nr:ABC transporter substrate-binding protein [Eubacteriales bacterium]MDH7566226.1 ABC transporter substrate-binding protein [Clostridiales bacterium]